MLANKFMNNKPLFHFKDDDNGLCNLDSNHIYILFHYFVAFVLINNQTLN